MIVVRKSAERGWADHGWLKSQHSFSFADYYDPSHMGFRSLRVINEDRVAGGAGFPMHGHRDMEIITYVLAGALEHKDSHGNSGIILPGEVQRMSAGSGVSHSEFNHQKNEFSHFLQIWIQPSSLGGPFDYAQGSFSEELEQGHWTLLVSPTGSNGSISLRQDMDLWAKRFPREDVFEWSTLRKDQRHLWVQWTKGKGEIGGIKLEAGDGLSLSPAEPLSGRAELGSEFLLFDLP
jgi:quercetin 2,3-dioxygenase